MVNIPEKQGELFGGTKKPHAMAVQNLKFNQSAKPYFPAMFSIMLKNIKEDRVCPKRGFIMTMWGTEREGQSVITKQVRAKGI